MQNYFCMFLTDVQTSYMKVDNICNKYALSSTCPCARTFVCKFIVPVRNTSSR